MSFTYAEAQMRIDDPSQKDEITVSLRHLNELAKILKGRRIEQGYGKWLCLCGRRLFCVILLCPLVTYNPLKCSLIKQNHFFFFFPSDFESVFA